MKKLSTFEDIFNKLLQDYQGRTVEVETRQNGVRLSSFITTIDEIKIKALDKKNCKKWSVDNKHIGLLLIEEGFKNSKFSIPFILGFNTMQAIFLENGATISSLNLEYIIKKRDRKQKSAG